MTKFWHKCITCLKMKKSSKSNMGNICKLCLENNHCGYSEKCDCSICNDNAHKHKGSCDCTFCNEKSYR